MEHSSAFSAVVMGDLVQSERSSSPSALHDRFNEAIDRQNDVRIADLASPLTITLGDEFQGIVTSLVAAIRIARDIRFALLSDEIECRFAIGAVDLKTPLNTQRAWNMMGPGLAETRARLNEKRPNTLYGFTLPGHPVLETMLEASGVSLTAIERDWTKTQRHDIQALIEGATPDEIAKRRNVLVHTIYKVRSSGDFDLYMIHWNAIEQALAELDRTYGMRGTR